MHQFATDLLAFGLWVLALARVTRLFTKDEITDPLRVVIFRRFGQDSSIAYFAECPWCVSIWFAFGSAWYVFLLTDWTWWWYPAVALTGSYLTGLFAANLEPEEDYDVMIENDRK